MAKKKKENELTYLQLPLPSGRKSYRMTKRSWSGLNYRQTVDTGALSMESNISTAEAPYLVPSQRKSPFSLSYIGEYENPISLFGFGNFLLVIYKERNTEFTDAEGLTTLKDVIKVDYIVPNTNGKSIKTVHTGIIGADEITTGMADYKYENYVEEQRSVVQFNTYDTPTDPLTGEYVKRLVVFPDKVSMFMYIVDAEKNPEEWTAEELALADIKAMHCYDDGTDRHYYVIKKIKNVEEDEDGVEKVTYSREIKSVGTNQFVCDAMEVTVKAYTNDKAEVDKSGATVYPPPESANKNYYYKNTFNEDVYHYCEYETAKQDEDGNWIPDGGTTEGWKVSPPPAVPNIKYATVHLSRLFGVDDARVYASGYNDYTNWNLDSIGDYNESNAWCSPAQSNTKAGGSFTGVTNYQGHLVCFKRDFMHEIYNTSNPFRLQDVYAEGAIDHRSIQDVDGKLIFVSDDDVKIYTGSNPRIIGYNLNIRKYKTAVSGTDGRCYYLYCEDENSDKHLFVYDTYIEHWSERNIEQTVLGFGNIGSGLYMLCEDGVIYKIDTDDYRLNWSFETDLITNETVDIKHLKKLQMFADIGADAWVKVYALYDDEVFTENAHLLYDSTGRTGQRAIRVKPRMTANYGVKLHFEGYGYVKLYELELLIENGGGLYV